MAKEISLNMVIFIFVVRVFVEQLEEAASQM